MITEEFGGDVLLNDTLDGPEIDIVNGLIMSDGGFQTAVYLSLFGGNKDDMGEIAVDKSWWGNKLAGTAENQKMVSRFQAFIRSAPITSKNLRIAEAKAKLDLKWLKDDGAADNVDVSIVASEIDKVLMRIDIEKEGEILESGTYSVQWEAMKNGIRE